MKMILSLLTLQFVFTSFHVLGKQTESPNVVMILSDDQGYADYGFMGHSIIETPHLDLLAAESLRFERGYVTTALCSSSLSTMLTGLYPHEHGTTGNDPLKGISRAPWIEKFEKSPQLPAILAKKGYLTLHTGKYWHGKPSRSGFTHDMGDTKRHGSAFSLSIGRNTMEPIYNFIEEAEEKKKPFFVWYAPFLPHTPHNPPAELEKKYQKLGAGGQSKYFAMCEWFDQSCGQLLDYLDEKKLEENTLVVYACDNGWGSLKGLKGSVKASPYELGVRTPIMFRWPNRISPEVNKVDLASNLDLVPTILRACGLDPKPRMQGIDLLDRKAVSKRDALFLENFTHDMLDANRPEAALRARSIVLRDWKLTLWRNTDRRLRTQGWQIEIPEQRVELFNLTNDPEESQNLAQKNPEVLTRLTARVNHWWNPK